MSKYSELRFNIFIYAFILYRSDLLLVWRYFYSLESFVSLGLRDHWKDFRLILFTFPA